GRTAIGAAGVIDVIVGHRIDLGAELDVPDFVPGRPLVGAGSEGRGGGNHAERGGGQPASETAATHGSTLGSTRECVVNMGYSTYDIRRRRGIAQQASSHVTCQASFGPAGIDAVPGSAGCRASGRGNGVPRGPEQGLREMRAREDLDEAP